MITASKIPPGGEGKIKVQVNTRGRSGKLKKGVTVFSNDPKTPRFRLTVKGTLELLLGFKPRYLNLGQVRKGTVTKRKIKLVGKAAAKAKLSQLQSDKPDRLEVRRVANSPELELTFRAGPKEGRFNGRVTAKTDLEQPKRLRLSVFARVTGDIVPNVSWVVFPRPAGKALPRTRLRLKSLSGKPFKIKGVSDPKDRVKSRVVGRSAAGIELELEYRGTEAPRSRRGTFDILTDRRDQRRISIRYSVRSKRRRRRPRVDIKRSPRRRRPGRGRVIRSRRGRRPGSGLKSPK